MVSSSAYIIVGLEFTRSLERAFSSLGYEEHVMFEAV
jgi:hypothetical protein